MGPIFASLGKATGLQKVVLRKTNTSSPGLSTGSGMNSLLPSADEAQFGSTAHFPSSLNIL